MAKIIAYIDKGFDVYSKIYTVETWRNVCLQICGQAYFPLREKSPY